MNKEELAKILKIDEKKAKAKEIEKEMAAADFWSDQTKSAAKSQQLSFLNDLISKFEAADTPEKIETLSHETLYSGEFDQNNTVLFVHAGAGGTEAQDWADMLLRMYLKFAQNKNYQAEILDQSPGEEAGIKSAELKIEGVNAYGNLKSEAGVHRLVRISPYDADKARHTSFALVEVIPEFDEVGDIEINDKDLKIDVFRSSGHGGQSVNTTDSAVRITHLPTKTVVSCQNERSQLQNKEKAMKILKSRIKKLELDEKKEREQGIKGEHTSAEWGNQIRSYVLQPYQQVKDHRTDFTSSNPTEVLNGNIDGFINAYLKNINS
ncbi:MAG: peptide chain release factor 2 [Dehalococcoidales bacterium]|nr:peptide chain release factor 2 [Dehalococcoidales bacterium]